MYEPEMFKIYARQVEDQLKACSNLEETFTLLTNHTTTLDPIQGVPVSKFFKLYDVLEFGCEQDNLLSERQLKKIPELLSNETRKKLANAMLKRVYEDPKMLLHFANNAKQSFNVVYPNLFPPAWKESSSGSFTFYYNGLLEITQRLLEDAKQRNEGTSV